MQLSPFCHRKVKLCCTKYPSPYITPVGRLCLWWFSMDPCLGSDWQPAPWQGTVILWVIIFPGTLSWMGLSSVKNWTSAGFPVLLVSLMQVTFLICQPFISHKVRKADNAERHLMSDIRQAAIWLKQGSVSHWGNKELHLETLRVVLLMPWCIPVTQESC